MLYFITETLSGRTPKGSILSETFRPSGRRTVLARAKAMTWNGGRGVGEGSVLTGEELLLLGLDFRLQRGSDYSCSCRPVDGRRPGKPDDDRLEPCRVTGARSRRWRYQIRVVRVAARERAVRSERDAPRRRSALPVVRLARVRAEHVDGDQPHDQRVVLPLFVQIGVHRQHPVGPPPSYDWPRPTDCVAMQRGRAVQRHDNGRALLANYAGRSEDRVCASCGAQCPSP